MARASADAVEHPARLNVVLVGATSKARKGTAQAQVRRVMALADSDFIEHRVLNGFGSGEAIVDAVASGGDPRLLILEPEWGRLLSVAHSDGSTISPLLREAWDGSRLAIRTRKASAVASGAHIAVVGHVTPDELRSKLTDVEVANGFANRHLFAMVRRSKLLPSGGNLDESIVNTLGRKVGSRLDAARKVGTLQRSHQAAQWWDNELYPTMAYDDPGGLVEQWSPGGAQVLRLYKATALTARVAGRSRATPPLKTHWAVLAVPRASVVAIFGDCTGNPVADKVLEAVRTAGAQGLTTDDLYRVLGRHVSAERRKAATDLLARRGLIEVRTVGTRGRSATVFVSCEESE